MLTKIKINATTVAITAEDINARWSCKI